jgi:electron transfer flavoprotein alpha subunit
MIEEAVCPGELKSQTERLRFESDDTSAVPIQEADVVVAGGRGMRDARSFEKLFGLAQRLGGVVGASRVAVDQGWIPYSHQVGLSGKSVTPKLYFALGISGSANHLAGMSGSEVIIAVNKDPDASILRVADLGIVGDLSEVLPALLERLGVQDSQGGAGEAR